MPFVAVPANVSAVRGNETNRGEYVWTWPNGKVYVIPQSATLQPAYRGVANRAKGKPVPWKQGKWAPCRPYGRGAYTCKLSGTLRASRPRPVPNEFIEYVNVPWIGNPVLTPDRPKPYMDNGILPTPMSVNTRNRLITECLQKVNDRKVNLGEAFAESRQSISMIARRTSQLARFLLALRRGRLKAALSALGIKPRQALTGKTASDLWLEYQYGWKPLVSDVYDGYQTFRKGLQRPQLIRAVRRLSEQGDPSLNNAPGIEVTGKAERYDQLTLFYSVQDSYLNTFSQIGLINPLEVAWAVVPWSFLIDWLVPVQSVLEACTATVGLDFRDGCFTSRAVQEYDIKDTQIGSGWFLEENSDLTYRSEWFGLTRTVLTSSPVPFLYYKDPFSSTHAANALALLRQLRR